jgi:hypothetical protein
MRNRLATSISKENRKKKGNGKNKVWKQLEETIGGKWESGEKE